MIDDLLASKLQQMRDNSECILKEQTGSNLQNSAVLQAEKAATLDDFIEMVGRLTAKTLGKKHNVVFMPDEGARILLDPSMPLDKPHIFYEIISRTPKGELKPRERRISYNDNQTIRVYGQKFKSLIQFNIAACEYKVANAVMKDFEEMMLLYTFYFKKNGVVEVVFQQHFTDRNYHELRQQLSVRSLQYYVETERLLEIKDSIIDAITL